MHIIDWRNTYFSLDQDSNNALTQLYQFLYSLKESRTIFGLLAGGLRLLEQLLSEDSVSISFSSFFFPPFSPTLINKELLLIIFRQKSLCKTHCLTSLLLL